QSDRRQSIIGVSPGDWNASTNSFDTACPPMMWSPDLVRLYYYAGFQAARGCPRKMDPAWARAVAWLSLTLVDRPLCGCMSAVWEAQGAAWAVSAGGNRPSRYSATTETLNSPLGTSRGAGSAWKRGLGQDVSRKRATALVCQRSG